MSGADGPSDFAEPGPAPQQDFHTQTCQRAIRHTLGAMRGYLTCRGLDAEACGTAEIVLAEALNNIAEHAYADTSKGDIRVTLRPDARSLVAEIIDRGRPLPGLSPPAARLPAPGCSVDAIPEGGFGWFLIHTLTDTLSYERRKGQNHLRLHFSFAGANRRT